MKYSLNRPVKLIFILILLQFSSAFTQQATSSNYRLFKYGFVGGNPNTSSQPTNGSYTLFANAIGGVADTINTNGFILNPGFLTPMWLVSSVDSLWFGEVTVDLAGSSSIQLVNQVFRDVIIDNIFNNNPDFTFQTSRTTLSTNETLTIDIDFSPSVHGTINDTLFIETDWNDLQIVIYGIGIGTHLFSSITDFNFTQKEMLHETETLYFYLKNDGNADNMYTTQLELDDMINFSIVNDPANPVWIADIGDSCSVISVIFHPQEVGEFNAEILILTNAYNTEPDGKVHLSLHGYGKITPAEPENVTISRSSNHMSANWATVTHSIYGEPLTEYPVVYYLVYRNDLAYFDLLDQYIVSATASPTFLDYNVTLYKQKTFYKIVAINELPYERNILSINEAQLKFNQNLSSGMLFDIKEYKKEQMKNKKRKNVK